ncbi:hypothetical protein [Azospirillum soli]|uniref:hypothetical protein n=1 Tax=Azospirillum soli TaxID=1304799 RepID=UPI001AE2CE03|nr:hypothetical protein [Azospirillum soli]MBP2311885.1 hypothetical protein [Azospirillum soli]
MVTVDANAPAWAHALVRSVNDELALLRGIPEHSKTRLPKAGGQTRVILVKDEAGGAVLAFNDGADWRRCTDRAVVS